MGLVFVLVFQKEKQLNKYPYTVLLVEDEQSIRQNYVVGLKLMFKEVFEAGDGVQGYALYLEKKPNIMIVDIDLPQLNGLKLIEKIRQKDRSTKIIILTAYSDTKFLLQASSLKLVTYLVKPVKREALSQTLHTAIQELQMYKIERIDYIDLKDELIWQKNEKELLYCNQKIALTPKEYAFLELFFSSSKKMFTYEEIFEHVWGYEFEYSMDKIKSMVKKLRKKLPKDIIENIYATGFKINY
jgi:DNA-binding response OmpR family regulator